MGSRPEIVFLSEPSDLGEAELGGKAARLAALARDGAPVPPGFCVVASAYRDFLESSGVGALVASLGSDLQGRLDDRELAGRAAAIRAAIEGGDLGPDLAAALGRALNRLADGPEPLFAVRSSALDEDQAGASFAGQLETLLGVPAAEVSSALRRCWASLWTERAIRYREGRGLDQRGAAMAVLVQEMVPCEVAGVAFSRHPVTGASEVVVEATWGLGEALAQGEVTPDQYVLDPVGPAEPRSVLIASKEHRRVADGAGTRLERVPVEDRERRALSEAQLAELRELLLSLEARFGCPQDVEWGFVAGRLYLFQARPVTVLPEASVYSEALSGDGGWWTSGFLEERFPEPLSPLGWSAIRPAFERFALRDPLRYLGSDDLGPLPLTRLYRGHPYVNVEVFQRLYKLFPEALLPEDAWRYFPDSDTSLRRLALRPRSLADPRLWARVLGSFAGDPGNWSPLHNHREWERLTRDYDRTVAEIGARLSPDLDLPSLMAAAAEIDRVNGTLLRIHRWSLTHADLLYTLLRRLAVAWAGPSGAAICSNLVAHLSDRSLEMDAALGDLVDLARRSEKVSAALNKDVRSLGEVVAALDGEPEGREFAVALEGFLATYGHRSFSLDIVHPGFAADPMQVVRLLASLLEERGAPRDQRERREAAEDEARRAIRASRLGGPRWAVFRRLLHLTQIYVRLREDQRFYWQKGLAALRRVYLLVGARLVDRRTLAAADDVFYLTRDEIAVLVAGDDSILAEPRAAAASRRAEFGRLRAEFHRDPAESYPRFLHGGRPVRRDPDRAEWLRGQPVSAGRARGRVRVVLSPDSLPDLQLGEILVTRGADPGWTPLFGKIGGLVMESGGQLSHGSVVAREYGIPAVVGVAGATASLRDGDEVLVDGEAGTVARLAGVA